MGQVLLFFLVCGGVAQTMALNLVRTQGNACENQFLNILPDPDDCRNYILCFLYKEYIFGCPRDLLYDPASTDCVAWVPDHCRIPISNETTTTSTTTTQPPTTTTQPPTTTTPPPTTTTQPPTTTTPPPATTTQPPTTTTQPPTTTTPPPTTTTQPPTTTTPPPTTTTEPPTTTPIPPPECTMDTLSVTADIKDCKFYYECFYGTVLHYRCRNNLYFDNPTKECVPEEIVRCLI